MAETRNARSPTGEAMLDPRVMDPDQELVDTSSLAGEDVDQAVHVLESLRRWRKAEERSSLRARDAMRLNETDMKALRYLVVAKNRGLIVTPGALALHLNISSASTTKVLDRLNAAGHIERTPHPTDRRALAITIAQPTHEHVRDTVGKNHARQFEVVAQLTPAERDVVIRFLSALSDACEKEEEAASL